MMCQFIGLVSVARLVESFHKSPRSFWSVKEDHKNFTDQKHMDAGEYQKVDAQYSHTLHQVTCPYCNETSKITLATLFVKLTGSASCRLTRCTQCGVELVVGISSIARCAKCSIKLQCIGQPYIPKVLHNRFYKPYSIMEFGRSPDAGRVLYKTCDGRVYWTRLIDSGGCYEGDL